MNEKITQLENEIKTLNQEATTKEVELQVEWDNVFNDSTLLKEWNDKLDNVSNCHYRMHNKVPVKCVLAPELSNFNDCLTYLETYLLYTYNIMIGGNVTLGNGYVCKEVDAKEYLTALGEKL